MNENIEIGSKWQGKNNEGDVLIVWANHNRVHYDYLNSLGNPMKDVYDVSVSHFLEYFEPKTDMVNHPPHYKDASGVECIEVTKHMSFCGGNCFKYLYRAGSKGDLLEDLKKAMWYADYARVQEGRIGLFQRLKISKNIKTISKHRYYRISSVMDLILSRDWMWVATEIDHLIRDIESRESLRGEKVTLENAGSNL